MVSPAFSSIPAQTCSPTTAKLRYRNSDFPFPRMEAQSHKQASSLSIWNLPSLNSSWNRQYYCYKEYFKLRCGRARSTQSTEAKQHVLLFYVQKQSEATVSFPDSYRNQPQPLQVSPFYHFLPSDGLVCNHCILLIRDMHAIKLTHLCTSMGLD